MPDSSDREMAVFTEALQQPPGKRGVFLERACAGDEALLHRVQELLAAHERAEGFLNQAHPEVAPDTSRLCGIEEGEGDRIGRYKLLQQIGEGGCGVVFMAEQEEPVRRRVALKVVKPGMDSKGVIARFEAERQALAIMDHPNIARVLDAGTTDRGRPYFVMELVRGLKITDYCDQHALSMEARLELFVQVCHAVEHAHQKGIIHRDLKPSNVLVTSGTDGNPQPKVIDFGIAKAVSGQALTDKTLFTAFEMLIGTPAYMSPEQAELASVDVDTRSDIYSLGVLLYELVTGSTPFNTHDLLKRGLDEVRRVIRDQEPVRPSTKLGTLLAADLTAVASSRKAEPLKLIRSVRGDIDWIILKTLEKNRTRRYQTASALAADIRHHLANEAVAARPPSALYRLQTLVRRHRLLFTGLGAIVLLLAGGFGISMYLLARENEARRDADSAREQAENNQRLAQIESAKSRQVTRFLTEMLQGVGPSVALGRDTTMLREILDRTADRVGSEMTNQPAVEAELRALIGRLYLEIGVLKPAEEMHRMALALKRDRSGSENTSVADSLSDLGQVLWKTGKLAEAEGIHREALAIRQRALGPEHSDVAASLGHLANIARRLGRVREAEALTREALRINQKAFGEQSLPAADSLRSLAIVLGDEGNRNESEAVMREVLAIRRSLLGTEHPDVAAAMVDLAWAAGYTGKQGEAETLEREALAMRRRLLGQEHPDVAKSLYSLGARLGQRREFKESSQLLKEALAMQQRLLGGKNPATLDTLRGMARLLAEEGKLAEAEALHRESLALWSQRGEGESPQALSVVESLARVLMAQRKFGDAEALLDQTLSPSFMSLPASADLLALRCDLKARRGLWAEAAADIALAHRHRTTRNQFYCLLAALLIRSQDFPGYEDFRKRLLTTAPQTTNAFTADQIAKAALFRPGRSVDQPEIARLADLALAHGAGDPGALPYFQVCKALSEYRQGRYAEAVDWARRTLAIPGTSAHGHASAIAAMALWQLGQKDEARTMLARGEALAPATLPRSLAEDPGPDWHAWLFARVSLDEAAALIQSAATPKTP